MARRRALGDDEVLTASAAVAVRVLDLLGDAAPARIGASFPTGGEVDPAPVTDRLRQDGWTTWYPVVDDGPPAPMTFRRWDDPTPPPAGRFGIPTPPVSSPSCAAADLAIVLVPLVLFGPGGARAGRGAGYYDRTFSWLRSVDRPARPLLVGLGHDFQEARDLVAEPWDVPLDVVITPTRTLRA